ncbi:hypothetical protein TKK_0010482 [Trichogramma kaykai]
MNETSNSELESAREKLAQAYKERDQDKILKFSNQIKELTVEPIYENYQNYRDPKNTLDNTDNSFNNNFSRNLTESIQSHSTPVTKPRFTLRKAHFIKQDLKNKSNGTEEDPKNSNIIILQDIKIEKSRLETIIETLDEEELVVDNLTKSELFESFCNPEVEPQNENIIAKYLNKVVDIAKIPLSLVTGNNGEFKEGEHKTTEHNANHETTKHEPEHKEIENKQTVHKLKNPYANEIPSSSKATSIENFFWDPEGTQIDDMNNSYYIANHIKEALRSIRNFDAKSGKNTAQFISDVTEAGTVVPLIHHKDFIKRLREKLIGQRAQNIDLAKFETIEKLTKYLDTNYGHNKSSMTLITELGQLAQRDNESVFDYSERLTDLKEELEIAENRDKSGIVITENCLVETFIRGLKQEIITRMPRVTKLEDAYREAQRIEKVLIAEKELRNKNNTTKYCVFCNVTSHETLNCEVFLAIKRKHAAPLETTEVHYPPHRKEHCGHCGSTEHTVTNCVKFFSSNIKTERKEPEVITINKMEDLTLCGFCNRPNHTINNCIEYWNSVNPQQGYNARPRPQGYNNNYSRNNNYNNNNNRGNNGHQTNNQQNNRYNNNNRNRPNNEQRTCYHCGKAGHIARDCYAKINQKNQQASVVRAPPGSQQTGPNANNQ